MPYDLLLESKRKELPLDIERYVKDLVAAVNDAWSEARQRMGDRDMKRQMRALTVAKTYNPPPVFEIGQLVVVKKEHLRRGEHKEAVPLWVGPFPVIGKVSDFVYLVEKDGREDSVHVDRLKAWHERVVTPVEDADLDEDDQAQPLGDSGETPDGESVGAVDVSEVPGDVVALPDEDVRGLEEAAGEYEVEELLGKRVVSGKRRPDGRERVEYLVKWKNWDDSFNTWEREDNLLGAADLVREFEQLERGRRMRAREERRQESILMRRQAPSRV